MKKRRGAAAVEFAVVAPIFIGILLGMIEYGYLIRGIQRMTNLSREAARVAVSQTATRSEADAYMAECLEAMSLTNTVGLVVEFDPPDLAAEPGAAVTATVKVPYRSITPFPSFFLDDKIIQCQTTMRKEF